MALTRKLLESMGLEPDKVSSIIEAHVETVDSLKSQIDKYKADAGELEATKTELTNVKAELEGLKVSGGDWKKKYEEEHNAYETYKNEQVAKELNATKDAQYRALLKGAGVSDKLLDLIMKGTDLSNIEIEDGKIKDSDRVTENIKAEYSAYITEASTKGANTVTPPNNMTIPKYTHDEIAQMSADEINANWDAIRDSMKG